MTRTNLFPFKRAHDPEPVQARASVPLNRALLCASCDSIFEAAERQQCPACGSKQAVALGRVLGRTAG